MSKFNDNNRVEDKILHGDIGKLLLKLALPAIVAQLINALYNIVDRMYIGHIKDVGALSLTGLGLTFPIIIVISAFSAFVGMGGAPLASIKLGENDRDKAEEILGNSFSLLIIFGILLTIVSLLLKDKMLMAFGASDKTFNYANKYLTIYIYGTMFVMLSMGLNSFISSQGFSKMSMITILIGAILNIILDPIFIYGLDMGVEGAALATIISQAVSALWVVQFLMGKKTLIRIKTKYMHLKLSNVKSILSLGLSPFTMQATTSLVQITVNTSLQKYGGDMYVGAMTIMNSIMQIFFMPIVGITQGAQPIIGYNYGAKNYNRVKTAVKYSITFCMIFSICIWAASEIIPEVFIRIFSSSEDLTQITVNGMRIFMGMMFMLGAQTACQNFFLSIGKAKTSIFLALLRKIILLIPLTLVLPLFFGVNGILFAEPISDGIATTVTILTFISEIKNLKENKQLDNIRAEEVETT